MQLPLPANAGWRDGAALVLLLIALINGAGAAMIQAKAMLAPVLIDRAWEESLADAGRPVKPWPWADTWPVARLVALTHAVDLPVLAGASGNALAFAPGYAAGAAQPGVQGLAVIGGHRDTHFAFLREIAPGDELRLQLPGGEWREYRVESIRIVDARREQWSAAEGDALLLVTCYPFDALQANGPLRYVVRAIPA